MVHNLNFPNILGWTFGAFVLVVGILNLFRGNNPGLGMMYIFLSAVYFPPMNVLLKRKTGFSISYYAKAILAILLIWVTLAVGAIAEGYYPEIIDSL